MKLQWASRGVDKGVTWVSDNPHWLFFTFVKSFERVGDFLIFPSHLLAMSSFFFDPPFPVPHLDILRPGAKKITPP